MKQSVKSIATQSRLQTSPARLLLFGTISQLLHQENVHPLCYASMLIVECIQLLFYALHSRYGFLWNTPVVTGLQYCTSVLM